MKHQAKVKKIIGWSLVVLGVVIFILGGAHEWYEETFVHKGWNKFVDKTGLPAELMKETHAHEVEDFIPHELAPWLLLLLIIIPIVWYYIKQRRMKATQKPTKRGKEK